MAGDSKRFFVDGEGGRPAEAVPYDSPRAMTAGSAVLDLTKKRISPIRKPEVWQTSSWDFFDQIGELKYSFGLISQLASRATVFAGLNFDESQIPMPGGDFIADVSSKKGLDPTKMAEAVAAAGEVMAEIKNWSEIIRLLAMNYSVAGECYLHNITGWSVASVTEFTPGTPPKFSRRRGGSNPIVVPRSSYVARLWRAHPRWSGEADSTMLGVLDSCEKLVLFDQAIRAITRSRLGAGIVFVPSGLTPLSGEPLEDALARVTVAPVEDESAVGTVAPMILQGPIELADKIKRIDLARQIDPAMVNLAEITMNRLLDGIDIPKNVVSGFEGSRYCVDTETEILTRAGWRQYDEIAVGDTVLTLNHETGLSEWQPVEAVNVYDVVDEPMLSLESNSHSSLSTMNHRWPVLHRNRDGSAFDRRTVRSDELNMNDRLILSAPSAELPSEPKYLDDFVELVSWYWTEGFLKDEGESPQDECIDRVAWKAAIRGRAKELGVTRCEIGRRLGREGHNNQNAHITFLEKTGALTASVREELAAALEVPAEELHAHFKPRKRRSHAVLAQSLRANPEHVARIRGMLTRLFGPAGVDRVRGAGRSVPQWSESKPNINEGVHFFLNHEITEMLVAVCPGKGKVTDLDFVYALTPAQLQLFIDVAILADGHDRLSNGYRTIGQVVPARLDAFEMACTLLGQATSRTVQTHPNDNWGDQDVIRVKRKQTCQPVQSYTKRTNPVVSYTGTIWCPTTPNHTWFARRNGKSYFTNNSVATVVDDALYKAHIEPLLMLICDGLTSAFLWPLMRKKGIDPKIVEQFVVWYNPTKIVTRPDKSQSANEGFDRYLLSGDAWRTARGYTKQDAPAPDEMLKRLAMEKVQIQPDLGTTLIEHIAPDFFNKEKKQGQDAAGVPSDVQSLLNGEQVPPVDTGTPAAPGATAPGVSETPGQTSTKSGGPVNDNGTQPPSPLKR